MNELKEWLETRVTSINERIELAQEQGNILMETQLLARKCAYYDTLQKLALMSLEEAGKE